MDINNILNKIENYKTATAERAEQERIAAEHHHQSLLDQIRVMKPDIDNLIKVAETAREAGIPLLVSCDCFNPSYERGDFFTDATTHKVGFVPTSFNNKAIIGVGFEGGGCCGQYDFFTDGVAIYDKNRDNGFSREASTEHLEKFIEKFPEFERAFYEYIEQTMKCEITIKPKYYIEVSDYNGERVFESRWFDSEIEAENWWKKEFDYFGSGDYLALLLKTKYITNDEDDYDVEFVKYL